MSAKVGLGSLSNPRADQEFLRNKSRVTQTEGDTTGRWGAGDRYQAKSSWHTKCGSHFVNSHWNQSYTCVKHPVSDWTEHSKSKKHVGMRKKPFIQELSLWRVKLEQNPNSMPPWGSPQLLLAGEEHHWQCWGASAQLWHWAPALAPKMSFFRDTPPSCPLLHWCHCTALGKQLPLPTRGMGLRWGKHR